VKTPEEPSKPEQLLPMLAEQPQDSVLKSEPEALRVKVIDVIEQARKNSEDASELCAEQKPNRST